MDPANASGAPSRGRDIPPSGGAVVPEVVHENDEGHHLELPPEVWARVLEYLPMATVLSCGAVSRSMLHDAVPRLTRLRIDKSSQMNLAVASRFPEVAFIQINSLLIRAVDDEFTEVNVDVESGGRVVPFLSRFRKLERVHFGGRTEAGEEIVGFAPADEHFWEGEDVYPHEGDREAMLAFLDSVSRGFSCRALPENLEISGLCCPNAANGSDHNFFQCSTCTNACKKFPVEAVTRFECRGSSIYNARAGRSYGLDVCIDRARVESIIESRPGGRGLLCSEMRLLYLLGRGRLYRIVAKDGARAIHIVKFTGPQLTEIKRVIEYAELDVKKLSMVKMTDAVMRSFTKGEGDPIPAKGDRYFSGASIDHLVKKTGLHLDRNEICSDAGELVGHAHQIAWVLSETHSRRNARDDSTDAGEYEDIFADCLKLVRRFSGLENPPIQRISGAIPSLVHELRKSAAGGKAEYQNEAVIALRNILEHGTAEHRTTVLEAKPMQAFSRLLTSSNASTAKAAVLSLDSIVKCEGIRRVTSLLDGRLLFSRLVGLLDSKDNECVQIALGVLTNADVSQMKRAIDKGLFPHVVRLMKSPEVIGSVLAHCSVLLRKILEHPSAGKPHIERVLDSDGLVARLVELVRTCEDDIVNTNLTHVVIQIAFATSDQNLDVLVQEEGLLSVLVNQLDSPDGHAEIALVALEKISDGSPERCRLVLQAGAAAPLMKLLKSASTLEWSLLKAAAKAFSMLCSHNLFDPAEAKDALKLSTQLLSSNEKDLVSSSSWALYYLLDGLSENHLSEVVDKGLVRKVLKLLSAGLPEVLEPALEALLLITRRAGDDSVECITNCGGIACIKKTLFSSHDNIQKLACRALSNIVAGSEQQIQAVIDAKVVPCLFQVMTSEQNKEYALEALRAMTEGGTAAQIDYLVQGGCIHRLCDVIDSATCSAPILALRALKNIAKAGTEEAKLSKLMIESKLDDIMKEMLDLQRESKRFHLLRKKEAWLAVDALEATIETLKGAHQILKDQLGDEGRVLHSFEQKIAGLETETLGEAKAALRETKENGMKMLSHQMTRVDCERRQSTVQLSYRLEEAEKIAPKSVWYDRLANDDSLPSDIETVSRETRKAMSAAIALQTARDSDQRKADVDEIKTGLRRLFKGKEATKKRAKPGESEEPAGERRASKKQRKEEDGDDDDVIDLCSDSDSD